LVERPEEWKWSSFRAYRHEEIGPVKVMFQEWPMEIKACRVQSFGGVESPLIHPVRE
jgi:hypothetical protein